ncbi:MAG TPA: hypothetical protein VGN63_05595 [Flavisolibacter sp.]|nr:hypothetical protein [Flavisolibacter sp.]
MHILAHLFIQDFGVVLGGVQVFKSEHLAATFNGHTIGEGNGGGKSVPCGVKGKFFADAANGTQF